MTLTAIPEHFHLMFNTASIQKHPQEKNTQVVLHDSSTDPFSFFFRKRKEKSNSLHIITPKQKEVCLNQDTPNKFLVSFGDHVNEHVNEHESHQELTISTIQESVSLPFNPDGPIPPNFKFQLDLLDVFSKHQADLKLHDDIILVIKSHSNDQRLTFSLPMIWKQDTPYWNNLKGIWIPQKWSPRM